MHLVICTTDYPPQLGGIARYSAELAAALAARHRVTVIAPAMTADEQTDPGQPFTTIRLPNVPVVREMLALHTLRALQRSARIDCVLNTVWFPCGLVAARFHRTHGVRYAVSAHGSEMFDDRLTWRRTVKSLLRPWKRRMLEGAAVVLPVSGFTRDRL
ncbi:MAG TPA: glycosyltransferase, partial [Nitrospirales bacterium]|nr:glycosyltransferase [Nitrospirales bacterium]